MKERIDIQFTASGDPVVSCSGRQMSSFVDPRKEAKEWVNHYLTLLSGKKTIVVLGLGSGYHIEALAKVFPGQIIVVERSCCIVDHFRSTFPKLSERLKFISLSDAAKETAFADILTPYSTVAFAPAVYSFRAEYQQVFDRLVGRTVERLNHQFKLRGVDHYFCPNTLNFDTPAASFRHLAREQALPIRWRNLFRMMGELLK